MNEAAVRDALGRLKQAIEKAAAPRRNGPRIPGDGDGDGIPYEGKNRGTGGAKKPSLDLVLAASSKFSNLENAKSFQARHSKPTQVLQSEGGQFVVPPHAKGSLVLREAGHKVVLDYNGKPPQAQQSQKAPADEPAKMVNVGSAKWPLYAKAVSAVPKGPGGFTHKVPGFKAPELENHSYNGDVLLSLGKNTFSFSGKVGTHNKTGEKSYEYSDTSDGVEQRLWVTRSGRATLD